MKYDLVSVQGASGCVQLQSASVSVTIKPSPSGTIAGTTTICQFGASPSITLTGSGTSSPYTFTYAINSGANQQIATATGVDQTAIVVPTDYSGSFDYHLITVSDAGGCSFSPAINHAIVTINESPTATISGTTTVCENQTSPLITFTATGGGTPYIFTYKIDEGASQTIQTTGSDNSVTLPVPTNVIGSHTYSLLSVSGAGGCSQAESGSVIVTVNPVPTATIAASTAAVCQNSASPYVTLTGSGGSLPYTFVYSINGGASITGQTTVGSNLVIPVSTATVGDLTYQLISVKDGSVTGCESLISGSSVTIKVKPLPTATISPSQSTCLNEASPVVLFTGSGVTDPYTFTYKLNGGAEQTLTTTSGSTISLTIPTNASLSNVYTLTKVSSDGCSNPQSGSSTVVVHPLPTATISGATSVCQSGSKPVITLTGSGGTAPYTFSYSINGVAAPDLTTAGNSIVIDQETSVAGTYTYRLLGVTDQFGCHSVLNQAIDVVVKPLPTATVNPSTTTPVCQNSISPKITFTGSGGSAPFQFSYKINGGTAITVPTLSGQNSISVDVPTNLSGTFKYDLVSVSNGDGCSNTQNGSATITVKELPTLSSTLTPSGICDNTFFSYVPTSITSGATFTWSRAAITDNPAKSGAGNPNEMLVNNTAAALTAVYAFTTTANGCSNTENVSVIVSPLPTLTSTLTPDAICSNSIFSYTPISNLSSATYSWTRPAVAGITNPEKSGIGNPNETLVNDTKNQIEVTYYFTVSSNGCTNPATFPVKLSVNPAPKVVTASSTLVCPGTPVDLYSGIPILIEDFNVPQSVGIISPTPSGWTINPTNVNGKWEQKTSPFSIGSEILQSNDNSKFYLSDMRSANTTSTLTSPSFSTVGFSTVSFNFWQYYNDKDGKDNALVEYNDGSSWHTLVNYTTTQGSSSGFTNVLYALPTGVTNLKIRFSYTAKNDYYWAIDNVSVTGVMAGMNWTSDPVGFTSTDPNPRGVTPLVTTTYTATYTDPNFICPGTSSVTVEVLPTPVVTIDANYCTGNGKVRLTASAGSSYLWNTGATTQSIEVDVAGYFQVTVTDANGCVGQKDIIVSDNKVVNGDFSAGNTGFSTPGCPQCYKYVADNTTVNNELVPEGVYGIGTNAHNYHNDFWGPGHGGTGNFMIVNGFNGTPQPVVWQETITGLTIGTTYYFTAWARSLNAAGNGANLKFSINDVVIGEPTGALPNVSSSGPFNWSRFYGTWVATSTTAKLEIVDLTYAASGNDFGIDDISFGTLNVAPFTVNITDNDPCEHSDLQLIANITGGNYPLTYAWSGPNSFASTEANPTIENVTLNAAGTYNLSITDHYNCVYTTTKTVAVHPISKRTSAYTHTICSGSTFTITSDNLGDPSGTNYTWSAPTGTGFTGGTAQSTGASSISQTLVNTTSSAVVATYHVTPTTGSCVGLQFDLVVTIDPAATVDAGLPTTICAGSSVTLAGTIGGAATSVTWSAAGGSFSNKNSLTSSYTPAIGSGFVTLTLTTNDPTGTCPASASTVAIAVNEAPQVTVTKVTPVKCYGASTGAIDISVSGGTAPYTYQWSNGASSQDLTNLNAGVYTVTVKDAIGCSSTTSATITQPTSTVALSIVTIENVVCTENSVGSATVLATGGTPNYTYSWNTSPTQSGVKAAFNTTGDYIATATDANGCSASVTVPITIEENTPPVVTACPSTIALNGCGTDAITVANAHFLYSEGNTSMSMTDFNAAGGAATDNCGIVSSTYKDLKNGTCPIVVTRTFTFTDAKGLTATCHQTITIDDHIAPVWSTSAGDLNRSIVSGDAAALADAQALEPVANDNCDASVTLVKTSGSYIQGGCTQSGTYTNTWVAKDKCGNISSTYTQIITTSDTEKPVWNTISGALDRTVSCSDSPGLAAAQALFPVASDFGDHDVTNLVKISGTLVPSATCPSGGTYTNTWTVTDDCGNVSDLYKQVITVVDGKAPVWTSFPGQLDVKVDCGDDGALTAAKLLAPVATDNCGTPVYTKISGVFVPGSCGNTGSYTNTWTAADQCGNVSSIYKQVITIQDITPPTVICPPGLAINTGESTDPASTGKPSVTDYCDSNPLVSYSDQTIPGSCDGTYTIKRTWSAKDVCGNVGSCVQTINVQDVTPPYFSSPPPATISWCVKSIESAIYYAPTIDITPTRPDYSVLSAADKSLLDLNTSTFWDNGVNNPNLTLHWKIEYGGIVKAPLTGIGQLSAYTGELRFEGKPSGVVTSKITYWLVDPCGNVSTTVVTEIKILPRPDIIKTTH